MIISVPHTGTRTLQKVLGVATILHFGQDESGFNQMDEHIDFPIRDPLATSLSWKSYQCDRTDMDEFRRWEAAIAYLAEHEHTIHRMEDYPVLRGKMDDSTWWKQAAINHDLDTLKKLPEVEYLLRWYKRPEVSGFFRPHYGEFWWETKSS